ncbi:MAG TPA: xanthine dehydrogenase family protein molybdopterin-binding subunit [Candidatus Limnocylindria bacterium]|nr:xanthine dehydrogenase family protein molybdopterin-binding subunit [Candidatus Limnocylindria bacterium]
MNVVGQRVRRTEDPRFLTGRGQYVDDLKLEGALHATFIRSPWAHARITSVDTSGAAAVEGVQVFTAQDLGLGRRVPPPFLQLDEAWHQPYLAEDTVRFAGDTVAVVVADTREASVDASELVEVEYDTLPVVTDLHAAADGEVLLFEGSDSNVCVQRPRSGTDDELFAGCEVVSEGRMVSQRIAACPIEPRSTAVRVEENGRLTAWLCTQTPHSDRDGLAQALGVEPGAIRVLAPDVGGGFGGKGLSVEDVVVAALARKTGRPVRWTETRSEHMVSMAHGRAQRISFKIGGSREGKIQALRLSILADAGAYPGIGAFLPNLTALMASGVYAIPNIDVELQAVVTNTTPTAAVRGAGRPEATQVLERAIDTFARDAGLDPAEVRRRSFIAPDAFPYTTAAGATYDSGEYAKALATALDKAGYEQLRAQQAERRQNGTTRQLGIGISTYVEITNGIAEHEFGEVEIGADGSAVVKTGSFSHGQGHETTFAQIVADRLGIPFERITVLKGDTDTIARGTGTYGSKSVQIGGTAAAQASDLVVEKGKRLAAEELEANPEDMVIDLEAGRFHVAGAPEPGITWSELATALSERGRIEELRADVDLENSVPSFPFGAHVAVVEVDTETGSVSLGRMITVDDAGTIINPMLWEGQVHGGVAAGIAQALFEEIAFDEDGNPLNANLVSYCMPAATELPMFELSPMQTPTPVNPLGAKGIGEAGTIGATPAVQNAVIDALAHLGVRHIDMPLNGERVWRAIEDARASTN